MLPKFTLDNGYNLVRSLLLKIPKVSSGLFPNTTLFLTNYISDGTIDSSTLLIGTLMAPTLIPTTGCTYPLYTTYYTPLGQVAFLIKPYT